MAHFSEDDAHPVTRITAGSIGEPGRRVFILQAQYGKSLVSWVIEKDHAVALMRAIPRLLSKRDLPGIDISFTFDALESPVPPAVYTCGIKHSLTPSVINRESIKFDAL